MLVSNRESTAVNATTLVDLLRWRALHQPEQIAYIFLSNGEEKELRLTYRELDRRARLIAATLQGSHTRGERILLLYPPSLDFLVAFFACLYAGCIAVPAYPPTLTNMKHGASRLLAIAKDAQPWAILTTAPILSLIHDLSERYPAFKTIHCLVTDTMENDLISVAWHAPMLDDTMLAFLQYTSGSTGTPKGVMVSHRNLLCNLRMLQNAWQHPEQSAFVNWMPLFHDMGLIGNALLAVYVGAPCVLMSPMAFIQKPFRWLQAISRYKAHTSGGPNFAYDLCVRKITPEQRATLDLSSWKVAFNGAEPVRYQTLKRFETAFASCGFNQEAFYPGYGLAEATLFVSGGFKTDAPHIISFQQSALEQNVAIVSTSTDTDNRSLVSCGHAWLEQKIVVVDAQSKVLCQEATIGEIWVSGPNIAQGYWGQREGTQETFHAHLAESNDETYLRTGDLGFLKAGELFITGRLKDLIIIDGRNHYPQDIEETVEQSHPSLRVGCCVAISTEVSDEEQLVIFCEIDLRWFDRQEKKGPSADTLTTVVQAMRRHVASTHDLQIFSVTLLKPGSLPKTTSGKVRRQACHDGVAGEILCT